MNIKYIFTLSLILILNACANTPSHLIISPDILTIPSQHYNNTHAQLEVTDMRTSNHIVQILREGEAATLISAQKRLENTINQILTTQWTKQGLEISASGNNAINIVIEKAVISVSQQTLNYQSQTEIVLKVVVNNGKQTLTSTFNNRGNSEGPFKADIAVLERNFNQRLANLLTQILANKKINNFIN